MEELQGAVDAAMAQKVLLFEIKKEKLPAIGQICRKLGITSISVQPKDYGQQLGCLAGIKGFSRKVQTYTGKAFPAEMLVFSGMDSDQVDRFLDEYKKCGQEPVMLKAVLTQHNVFWNPQMLFGEMLREHTFFSREAH